MTAADLQIGSRFLLDTNVLLRLQSLDVAEADACLAVKRLQSVRAQLHITFQNISEFWNSCTRPKAGNGLELSLQETTAQLHHIEDIAALLTDTYDVYKVGANSSCNTA